MPRSETKTRWLYITDFTCFLAPAPEKLLTLYCCVHPLSSTTETPRNGIVVPEYGEAEVRAGTSSTLNNLLVYLIDMCESTPVDVREYMESLPFKDDWEKSPSLGDDNEPDDDFFKDEASSSQVEMDDLFLKLSISPPKEAARSENRPRSSLSEISAEPLLSLDTVPDGTAVDFICLDGECYCGVLCVLCITSAIQL